MRGVTFKCVLVLAFACESGLTSQGIYRKCGVNSKISAILESFLQDARNTHLKESEHQVDNVAGVLKRFFRNVKEGIFTSQGAPAWLHTIGVFMCLMGLLEDLKTTPG